MGLRTGLARDERYLTIYSYSACNLEPYGLKYRARPCLVMRVKGLYAWPGLRDRFGQGRTLPYHLELFCLPSRALGVEVPSETVFSDACEEPMLGLGLGTGLASDERFLTI